MVAPKICGCRQLAAQYGFRHAGAGDNYGANSRTTRLYARRSGYILPRHGLRLQHIRSMLQIQT